MTLLKLIWLILSIVLISIILIRSQNDDYLSAGLVARTDIVPSLNSSLNNLDLFICFLIFSYFILAISFNFSL